MTKPPATTEKGFSPCHAKITRVVDFCSDRWKFKLPAVVCRAVGFPPRKGMHLAFFLVGLPGN